MVFTDNNPVAYLQSAKLGAVEQWWVGQLASFDFEVKYRAGRENTKADALSRFPTAQRPQERTAQSATGVSALTVTAVGLDDTPDDPGEE